MFSLRKHLENQGVDTPEGMKGHLSFIAKTLAANPSLDIRRYRVNPLYPNKAEQLEMG